MKFIKFSIIFLLALVSNFDSRRIKNKNSSSTNSKGAEDRIITVSNASGYDRTKDTDAKNQYFDKARHDATKTTTWKYEGGDATFEKVVDKMNEYFGATTSAFKTDLNSGELKIKMVELYTRPFITSLLHELIGLCATRELTSDGDKRSYYLLIDRGSLGATNWGTRVSIYVLGATNTGCMKLVNWPSEKTSGRLTSRDYSDSISSDVKNLKLVLNAIFLYPQAWKKYGVAHNCQHFATSFYNFLTAKDLKPTNDSLSKTEELNALFLDSEKKLKTPPTVNQNGAEDYSFSDP